MSSTATLTPYSQPQLPLHFANQLLDCQIQLQLNTQHISPQIIMKLVELYRIGTEYYQSIRSYKYLYFQRKMNSIVKSDTILNSLNHNSTVKSTISNQQQQHKPNVVIIQSLTDFKKQQVTLTHYTQNNNQHKQSPQSLNSPQSKKPSTPFKRHLQQKFQSKQHQQQQRTIYQNPQIIKQKQQRQHQLRLLAKLQHKQKQQQLNMKISTLQPDKQMKKFIDTENKKIQQLSNIIGKVVQSQQQEFMKKLQERRERIKSNTEKKKRMTKSFSDNSNYWIDSGNNNLSKTNEKVMIQSQDKSVDNCQSPLINVQIQNPVDKSKRRHNIPSTRLFSSFIVQNNNKDNKQDTYGDDIVFQQVARP